MAQLVLKLRLVTPLLMFGLSNDSKTGQPEIRAASLRGGLRYWLRAVYGAAYGSNIDSLYDAESCIFGNTTQGSAVMLRVQHDLKPVKSAFYVLPDQFPFSGFAQDTAKEPQNFKQMFTLYLTTHPLRHDVFAPAFTSTLLLAFTLGGFGKRARRGGGALQIVGVSGNGIDEIPSVLQPPSVADGAALADYLKTTCFTYVEQAIAGLPNSAEQPHRPYDATETPAYPIFAPDHCRVFVGKQGYDDYLGALKQMWNLTDEYHHSGINPAGETIPDKWAWGYAKGKMRRASALYMRVYQCGDGKYYPLVTIFRGGRRDENWPLMQKVVDVFDRDPHFVRAYAEGNVTKW